MSTWDDAARTLGWDDEALAHVTALLATPHRRAQGERVTYVTARALWIEGTDASGASYRQRYPRTPGMPWWDVEDASSGVAIAGEPVREDCVSADPDPAPASLTHPSRSAPELLAPATTEAPRLLVLDTETTGLDATRHQVVQLAALCVDAETLREHWRASQTIRVEPWAVLDPRALAVHGLPLHDPAWQARAQPMPDVLTRFAARLESVSVVLGHNLAFDLRMLRASYARCGLAVPAALATDAATEDTQTLARRLQRAGRLPAGLSCGLASLCTHCGVSNDGSHRALADCVRTLAVYDALRGLDGSQRATWSDNDDRDERARGQLALGGVG